MQAIRFLTGLTLIYSCSIADSTGTVHLPKLFNGWDLWAVEISPDSVTMDEYRIEYYYPNGLLKRIDFFNRHAKFVKVHEFIYDQNGTLLKQLVEDENHRLKWYYYYEYDHIIMDWEINKYSPRGEWLDAKYLREIEYDTSLIDPSYFHVIPISVIE